MRTIFDYQKPEILIFRTSGVHVSRAQKLFMWLRGKEISGDEISGRVCVCGKNTALPVLFRRRLKIYYREKLLKLETGSKRRESLISQSLVCSLCSQAF